MIKDLTFNDVSIDVVLNIVDGYPLEGNETTLSSLALERESIMNKARKVDPLGEGYFIYDDDDDILTYYYSTD